MTSPEGTGETVLDSTNGYVDTEAAWSADGAHIAFARSDNTSLPFGATPDIWKMNPDGGGQTRLTTSTASDLDPAWSPTGGQIVFSSNRVLQQPTGYDLYTMNADGGNQQQLTSDGADDRHPAWSPDGTKIAFIRDFGKASRRSSSWMPTGPTPSS